jgi:hypothetical protein
MLHACFRQAFDRPQRWFPITGPARTNSVAVRSSQLNGIAIAANLSLRSIQMTYLGSTPLEHHLILRESGFLR